MAEVKPILITGSAGFVGRNLTTALGRVPNLKVLSYDLDTPACRLEEGLACATTLFHLAGVNRPKEAGEFYAGNTEFTEEVCRILSALGRTPKIVMTSSIQAELENPYGQSKRLAEKALGAFADSTGAEVVIYRLPNLFGKWSKPHYNSVVATFCHQIARGEPITISDPDRELQLVYIDDVIAAFLKELSLVRSPGLHHASVESVHRITLGKLAELLRSFRASRSTLLLPDFQADALTRSLYSTYLSYLPFGKQCYPLTPRTDPRGSLAEFLKSPNLGQIFISHTRPGIIRGNHYHDSKTEKFLVVAGEGVIRLRQIHGQEVISFPVRGEDYRVVDIPPGYTHSIENTGTDTMVTLFWSCEAFDPDRPDTYPCEV